MYKITAHQLFHQIKKFDREWFRFSLWSLNENKNIFWDLATFIVDQTCQYEYTVCITHGFSNFSADFQTILSYD